MTLILHNLRVVPAHKQIDYFASAYALFCSHRDKPWQYETFIKSLRMPASIMAINDGKLLGYVLVSTIVDEIEIEDICVNDQHRQQGIAGILLQTVVANAEGHQAKHVLLEVADNNVRAISLYKKHHFTIVQVRKRYYQLHNNKFADAFLMRKDLTQTS